MRRVSYIGASFLTAAAVADALLPLVAALGISQTTETLAIPAVDTAGKPITVKLVIGPRSELISIPEESPGKVADTRSTLAYLRARTQTLSQPEPFVYYETATAFDADWAPGSGLYFDFDWYEIATASEPDVFRLHPPANTGVRGRHAVLGSRPSTAKKSCRRRFESRFHGCSWPRH